MPRKDKAARREYMQEWKARNRPKFDEAIGARKALGCAICGEKRLPCLDLHHRDPETKTRNITKMKNHAASFPSFLEELAKCDVICSNCHRVLHADHDWGQYRRDTGS